MKIKLLIVFLCFLSIACSEINEVNIKEFSKFSAVNKLHCEVINTPSVLYSVSEMILLDSVLITLDLEADTFFQVFQYPNCRYLGGSVRKGRGPKEEVSIFPDFKKINKNSFQYRSLSSIKLAYYNLETKSIEIEKTHSIPGDLMDFCQIIKVDSNYIGYDFSKSWKYDFKRFIPNTKNIEDYGALLPKVKMNTDQTLNATLFVKTIEKKPDGALLASSFAHFPIIRIYEKNGNLKNEVRYNNNQEFPMALVKRGNPNFDIDEVFLNYSKMKVTDRYIYALYQGRSIGEYNDPNEDTEIFRSSIHVFDWDGNPVKKIELDREIFAFCVDNNDSCIIASTEYSLNELYKYKLSE